MDIFKTKKAKKAKDEKHSSKKHTKPSGDTELKLPHGARKLTEEEMRNIYG